MLPSLRTATSLGELKCLPMYVRSKFVRILVTGSNVLRLRVSWVAARIWPSGAMASPLLPATGMKSSTVLGGVSLWMIEGGPFGPWVMVMSEKNKAPTLAIHTGPSGKLNPALTSVAAIVMPESGAPYVAPVAHTAELTAASGAGCEDPPAPAEAPAVPAAASVAPELDPPFACVLPPDPARSPAAPPVPDIASPSSAGRAGDESLPQAIQSDETASSPTVRQVSMEPPTTKESPYQRQFRPS